jgi:hypothetical protein
MNAREKKLLEEKIYRILKESMYEEFMGEEGEAQKDDAGVNSSRLNPEDGRRNKRASQNKEQEVIQWLKDDQENNAAVARELWPNKDEDTARSEFSKKVRGKDASGKPYSFDAKDVNRLYNIKNRFINKINESELTSMIRKSIKRHLNESSYDDNGNFDQESHNKDLRDRFTEVITNLNSTVSDAIQTLAYIQNAAMDERLKERSRTVINAYLNAANQMRDVFRLTKANRWDVDK